MSADDEITVYEGSMVLLVVLSLGVLLGGLLASKGSIVPVVLGGVGMGAGTVILTIMYYVDERK